MTFVPEKCTKVYTAAKRRLSAGGAGNDWDPASMATDVGPSRRLARRRNTRAKFRRGAQRRAPREPVRNRLGVSGERSARRNGDSAGWL
jgi:hypothetical protein